jgi:hypothetical protein
MTAAPIAHLRITLDAVEPAVVRRLEVPLTIHLDRLHLVLQAAVGWTNSHLYEIRARDVGWGVPDPEFGDGPLDAGKVRLVDVLEDVDGPWGYREFLDAIADPRHEEHDERLQWIGGRFDPADADDEALAQAVHSLAKKWTRKPSRRL